MNFVFFIIQVTLIETANTRLDRSAALVLTVINWTYGSCIGICQIRLELDLGRILKKNGRIAGLPEPEPESSAILVRSMLSLLQQGRLTRHIDWHFKAVLTATVWCDTSIWPGVRPTHRLENEWVDAVLVDNYLVCSVTLYLSPVVVPADLGVWSSNHDAV